MHMRKKKWSRPELAACPYYIQEPEAQKGNWAELFPKRQPLHLELGCGKGRFTADMAEQNPDMLLIAVEKVPDAMVVAMERVKARGLKNVWFIDGDAALLPDMCRGEESMRALLRGLAERKA